MSAQDGCPARVLLRFCLLACLPPHCCRPECLACFFASRFLLWFREPSVQVLCFSVPYLGRTFPVLVSPPPRGPRRTCLDINYLGAGCPSDGLCSWLRGVRLRLGMLAPGRLTQAGGCTCKGGAARFANVLGRSPLGLSISRTKLSGRCSTGRRRVTAQLGVRGLRDCCLL